MNNLSINGWKYKTINLALSLAGIPAIFIILYGMTLYSIDSYILGYITLLVGVSMLIFAISNIFDYIHISGHDYDWKQHINIDENGIMKVQYYPYLQKTVDLSTLKKLEIKKEDSILYALFITDTDEIEVLFTPESYDTLLNIKQIYTIGW